MSHRMSIRMNSRVHNPENGLCCSYSDLCTEKEIKLHRIMFSSYTIETISHTEKLKLYLHTIAFTVKLLAYQSAHTDIHTE